MNLATQVRELLAKGPTTFRKLHEQIGGDDAMLWKAVYNMQYRGLAKIAGDDKVVTLLARKAAPPQGRRAKPAGKGKTVKRPYKSLVEKHASAKANGADLRDLALDNLLAAGALLRQAVEDGVDSLDGSFAIKHALDNQARAEKILAATKR